MDATLDAIQQLRSRAREARHEASEKERELHILRREAMDLDRQADRLLYPCPCVVLDNDIRVYTTSDLEVARRNIVGASGNMIGEKLSASKDCPRCHGSGKPVT